MLRFTVSFTSFLFINCLLTNAYCDKGSCDAFNEYTDYCKCVESPAPHHYNILCTGTDIGDIPIELGTITGHFRLLHIRDTNLTKIKADAFASPTFEQIFIEDNQQLTEIDKSAFNQTLPLKHLVIRNNPVLNVGDLFILATILQPTDQLELQSDQLTRIPADAFANNTNVNHVYLQDNKIATIEGGGDTFKRLTNLTQLRLDGNQMTTIEALEFNSRFNLSVYLNNNNLSMEKFMTAPVSHSKNRLRLYLQDNQFTWLNQTVFEPFVKNKRNELWFHNNEFKCDSRSEWVKQHESNIFNVWCMNEDASIFTIEIN